MVFNQLDPLVLAVCLKELLKEKKKSNGPAQLPKRPGGIMALIKNIGPSRAKRKRAMKRPNPRVHRPQRSKQADFELLAVYAAVSSKKSSDQKEAVTTASQANPGLVKSNVHYAAWRRRHYPLGLPQQENSQMSLPLEQQAEKKSAKILFEAELKLRRQMSQMTA